MIEDLQYWKISGKRGEAGKAQSVLPKDDDIIARSRDGITTLLEAFANPDQGYPSEPLVKEASPYSDYKHLARIREWAATTDDDIGGDV